MSNPTPLSRTKYVATPSRLLHPELDDRLGGMYRELPCVSEQVFKHNLQQAAVAVRLHTIGDQELGLSVRCCPS